MVDPIVITVLKQARVKKGVKLNMREEPYTNAKIDGQLFENAVVSIVADAPEGPEQFVQIFCVAYCSLKQLEIINNG